MYAELTAAEQRAGEYFEKHRESAYHSITEAVADSGIGYGTIVRFCQKLGCKGFQDFKLLLAADDIADARTRSSLTHPDDAGVAQQLRQDLNDTLRLLDEHRLLEAAELLQNSRTILIVGVASSAPLALSLAWKLSRIGIDARACTEGYVMAIQTSLLGVGDVLLAVSASGATKDILNAADIATSRGARVLSLTNFASSPLSQIATVALFTTASRDPLKAEIPSLIAGEAVAEMLLDRLLSIAPDRRAHLIKSTQSILDRKL